MRESPEPTNNAFDFRQSPLRGMYELMHATTPLQLHQRYVAEDQVLFKSGTWDYTNPELVINKIKTALEQCDPDALTEEERNWRQEILWSWHHHAISCAIWRQDKLAAQFFSEKALRYQSDDHPNKITRLLHHLVRGELPAAEQWAESIQQEPERSTATELLADYKTHPFFST